MIARLLEVDAARRIADLKARLQRVEPTGDPDTYQALFADVIALDMSVDQALTYVISMGAVSPDMPEAKPAR